MRSLWNFYNLSYVPDIRTAGSNNPYYALTSLIESSLGLKIMRLFI